MKEQDYFDYLITLETCEPLEELETDELNKLLSFAELQQTILKGKIAVEMTSRFRGKMAQTSSSFGLRAKWINRILSHRKLQEQRKLEKEIAKEKKERKKIALEKMNELHKASSEAKMQRIKESNARFESHAIVFLETAKSFLDKDTYLAIWAQTQQKIDALAAIK